MTRHIISNDAHCAEVVIHLVAKGELAIPAVPDPEMIIEEIHSRAAWVGPLMEGILHEPHTPTHLRPVD